MGANLVQFLGAGVGGDVSDRSLVQTYLSNGVIAIGDAVAFDATKSGADRALYVIEAAGVATVGNSGVIGVAKTAATAAGQEIEVYVQGYCPAASVAAATVAGSALIGPIGTAGRLEIEAPGTTTGKVFATALEADTSNVAAIYIH